MKYLLIILVTLNFSAALSQENNDSLRQYYDTTKWDMPFDDFVNDYKNYFYMLERWYIDYDEYIKFANQFYWFRNNSFTSYGYFRGYRCYHLVVKEPTKRVNCNYFNYKKYHGMKFKDAFEAIKIDYELYERIFPEGNFYIHYLVDGISLFFSYKYDENFIAEFRVDFDVNCYKVSSYDDIKIEYIYDCIEYDI